MDTQIPGGLRHSISLLYNQVARASLLNSAVYVLLFFNRSIEHLFFHIYLDLFLEVSVLLNHNRPLT